ncbi:unnamed protein product [Brassicogethes aeneus]|uniref:Uncharacterized protein n=1 Tax=Brassicogethes aeneus TaxID=1431903 RepID=A0A9P0AU36_BRAAE|nr:unnamed protein product [Brassicogethes aeneus]
MTLNQKIILNDLQCIIQGIHEENQEKSLDNNFCYRLKDRNNEENILELKDLLDNWENQCEKQFAMTSNQKRILDNLQGIHVENQAKSLYNNFCYPLKDRNNEENISELKKLLDDWENQCEKQFAPLEIININEDDLEVNGKTKNVMEEKSLDNNFCYRLKDRNDEENISELKDLLDNWENQCEKQFAMTSNQKRILIDLQCIIQGIHEGNQEKSLDNNFCYRLKDRTNEENISELKDLLDDWENQCEKQFAPLEIININEDDSDVNEKTKNLECCTRMTLNQKIILNDLQCIIQGIHEENQEKSLDNNFCYRLKDRNDEENISELKDLLDNWENQCEKQFAMTSNQKRILDNLQGIHVENQEKSLDNNFCYPLKDRNNEENISELKKLLDDWENQCEKQFAPLEIININEDDLEVNGKTKNVMEEKSLDNNFCYRLKDRNEEENISELKDLLDNWENQCEKQFAMTSNQKRILIDLQCIIQGIHEENQEKSLDNNFCYRLKDRTNEENISELKDLLDDWENQCEKQFAPLEIININKDDSDVNEKTKNVMEFEYFAINFPEM